MGLETGTYVSDLVATNPLSSDLRSVGDDHLRLIKSVAKATLPNGDRAQYFARFVSKTANYVILSTDMEKRFGGDATAGAMSLTLPTLGASNDGWMCEVAKVDTSINAVTIVGTINGAANLVLATQWASAILVWTGTAWQCYSFSDIGALTALTAPAVDDYIRILDTSARLSKKIALSDLLTVLNILTLDATPDASADFLLSYDSSALAVKKVTPSSLSILPRGYIDGLITSNGTDAVNDLNFAIGQCKGAINGQTITIATAMGKQLDANWTTGGTTGVPLGGRDSAAGIANGTYHAHAVIKSNGTGADIFYSTSATPATALAALVVMDATYAGGDAYLVMSFVRSGATILGYKQYFDGLVLYNAPILETVTPVFDTTQRNYALTVPLGINGLMVDCTIDAKVLNGQSAFVSGHPSQTLATPTSGVIPTNPFDTVYLQAVNHENSYARLWRTVNASAQVAVKANIANTTSYISTFGYKHPRGRDA